VAPALCGAPLASNTRRSGAPARVTLRLASLTPTDVRPQYIGGKWVPAVSGEYFDVVTPTTGKKVTQCARGAAADIELALDAAHAAAEAWGHTSATTRASILQKIAGIIRDNNELLAYVETIDNGKPIRETLNADIPLASDHFDVRTGFALGCSDSS